MTFDVLDETTLARLGNIDVWVSVYWDEPYNSEGSFTLEVRPTEENLSLLREGRWLVRTDAATRVPMRICHRSNENEDANLVVTGYPATWIYTKRVSASAIKNENAEAAMLALAKSAAPWPKLEVAEAKGFDTTFEQQTSGNTLFDYFKTVGAACDLGFRVVLMGKNSAKKLMFEVFRPQQPLFDQVGQPAGGRLGLRRHRLCQRGPRVGGGRRQRPGHGLGGRHR